MTKPIPVQGKDGKFKGSIGAGKTDIPSPQDTPVSATVPSSTDDSSSIPVGQQYAVFDILPALTDGDS